MKRALLLALVVVAVAAAVALAAGTSSTDVTLCAGKADGALSLATKNACARGEKKLTIAKQGPRGPEGKRGPQGEPGPAGAPGQDGVSASIQPEAVQLVAAATPLGPFCKEHPATLCYTEVGTYEWANAGGGDAAVGYQKDAAGYVHLQGTATIVGGGGGDHPEFVFVLPAAYRPLNGDRTFAAPLCNGSITSVRVGTDGAVEPLQRECIHLDGIAFHP